MGKWRFVGKYPYATTDSQFVWIDGIRPLLHLNGLFGPTIVVPHPQGNQRLLHLPMHLVRRGAETVRFAVSFEDDPPPVSWLFWAATSEEGPNTFEERLARHEGHWRLHKDKADHLPWPTPDPTYGVCRQAFLVALDEAESEAERVLYRGYSMCRLCGRQNGSVGFRLDVWEWPEGYKHYVTAHEVRPQEAFGAFVLGRFQAR
jgi:hypothetical protein